MKGTIFDTTFVGNTADPSIPLFDDFLTAETYKVLSERILGTYGGVSEAFGENSSTLTVSQAWLIDNIEKIFRQPKISEKNLAAIKFLDEWFSKPDDLGEDFWREFKKELEANRFRVP